MGTNEQLGEIREQIDEIDKALLPLFAKRMSLAEQVAKIKQENNMAIFDGVREQQVVDRAVELVNSGLKGEAALFMRSIMALSRERQRTLLFSGGAPLLPKPRPRKTGNVICAYQGIPGAWGEQAAETFFPEADKTGVEYFEDVFTAVKENRADYGVVPIENSQSGAIGENYDFLRKYGCFIVGRVRIEINQCLLAKKGVKLEDIREVYSHSQGFKQCGRYLKKHAWELTASHNTAVAAKTAAEAANGKTAAIGSRRAAELNGLDVLVPDIADSSNNRTAFVVIASEPEYDERSNMIAATFSTAHRSGALCEILLPLMAQTLNLARIESRPAGNGNYRFFVDIQGNINDPETEFALRQAASASEYFEVTGCYTLDA